MRACVFKRALLTVVYVLYALRGVTLIALNGLLMHADPSEQQARVGGGISFVGRDRRAVRTDAAV